MWRKDRFLEVFGAHPALPFGEDIFGGFTSLNKVLYIHEQPLAWNDQSFCLLPSSIGLLHPR